MRPDQILPSSFLDNLGTDWIAVNHQGTVIGRASTEAAVRRANPGAEAFFSAPDFDPAPYAPGPTNLEDYEEGVWTPAEEAPAEEAPAEEAPAEEAPVEEAPAEEAPVEEAPAEEAPVEEATAEEAPAEEAPAEEAPVEEAPAAEDRDVVLVDGSAFDHDGDGKPGGSMPKSRKRKPASR